MPNSSIFPGCDLHYIWKKKKVQLTIGTVHVGTVWWDAEAHSYS